MGRATAILIGILVLALLAGGLTEATLALGRSGALTDDRAVRPQWHTAPSPSPSASAAPSPSATPALPSPSITPAATPVPTPAPTVTTNSFVHLRSGKSTSTPILVDLNAGTVLRLLPDADAQWQQVQYNGLTGYVFKAYLTY